MLRMYDTLENKLSRFHKAFGHPVGKEFSVEDSKLPLALIQEERFKEAAVEARDSRWAKQTARRAKYVTGLIEDA